MRMGTKKKIYTTLQMDVLALKAEQSLLSASTSKSWLYVWLLDEEFDGGLGDGGEF